MKKKLEKENKISTCCKHWIVKHHKVLLGPSSKHISIIKSTIYLFIFKSQNMQINNLHLYGIKGCTRGKPEYQEK